MKKTVSLVLLVAMLLVSTFCGSIAFAEESIANQIWAKMAEVAGIDLSQCWSFRSMYTFGDTTGDGYVTLSMTEDESKIQDSVSWRIYPDQSEDITEKYFPMLRVLLQELGIYNDPELIEEWLGAQENNMVSAFKDGRTFDTDIHSFDSFHINIKYDSNYNELYCLLTATKDSLHFVMKAADSAPVVATQAPATEYDFKSFSWGASMEEVIAVEGTPWIDGKPDGLDANYIAYETTAVGLDMAVGYFFCDDGLYRVMYILTESHSNDSSYIEDYEKFKSAMEKKYGKALLDEELWESDSKKEYYADRKGDALSYGYLEYVTGWLLERSTIIMNMSADNYKIEMTVTYESKEISPGTPDYSDEI